MSAHDVSVNKLYVSDMSANDVSVNKLYESDMSANDVSVKSYLSMLTCLHKMFQLTDSVNSDMCGQDVSVNNSM